MDWKQYQELTAEFFRSLGCDAAVEAKIDGARAQHRIDVWVRFKKFGLEARWIIECKCWSTSVPKEKVLALKSVVEDVGADRGVLISAAGFQSGATRAAEKTNIMLTDLDELKQTAQDDLLASLLHRLETKATLLRYALNDLYVTERISPHQFLSKPRSGVDGEAVLRSIGRLAVLEIGFDRVRMKKPPNPTKYDETGQQMIAVDALEEFVHGASDVIRDSESTLQSQLASVAAAEKGAAANGGGR